MHSPPVHIIEAITQRLATQLSILILCVGGSVTAHSQTSSNATTKPPAGQSLNVVVPAKWEVGRWIWDKTVYDKQTCHLWRAFEIPKDKTVTEARLRITVHDGYRLLLDGREVGKGSSWRTMTEYDLSLLLNPGWHALAVDAFHDDREAGMKFGLKIKFQDGGEKQIFSDANWRIAPPEEIGWEAKIKAPAHWGEAVVNEKLIHIPDGHRAGRKPNSLVKVPTLQPVEIQFWQRGWFQAVILSFVVLGALFYLRLLAQLAVQSRARGLLQRERARIARDIHDELGARLTELALQGEVAQTEYPAGSTAHTQFAAISKNARALSGAMDEVVWMVNSQRDTLRDFATFACQQVRRFLEPTPIRCRLDVEDNLPEVLFELPVRRNLLLAVKEAVNNAAKYSQANELFLRIHRRGQTVLVVVEDNGVGFDPEQANPARNGLKNMTQRLQELGGQCRITSKPGTGCRVEFEVSLTKASITSPATLDQQEAANS